MSLTPPWRVDSWDLAADLAKVEQQWAPVRDTLGDPVRHDLRHAATSGWSAGEHAGHIVITALSIAERIERSLAEPERDRDQTWAGPAGAVLTGGDFPRGRAKAPEHLDPTGRTRAELASLLPSAVAAWASLGARAESLRACRARFRHFALGYMTSAEWVRFCAIHTAHHLAIAREIEQGARMVSA